MCVEALLMRLTSDAACRQEAAGASGRAAPHEARVSALIISCQISYYPVQVCVVLFSANVVVIGDGTQPDQRIESEPKYLRSHMHVVT